MTRRWIVPVATEEDAPNQEFGNGHLTGVDPSAELYRPSFYSMSLGIGIAPTGSISSEKVLVRRELVYTIVYADKLIPGDDEPLSDAALVSEDKLIVWVGRKTDLPQKYIDKAKRTYSVPYLMPGLWDCHVHFAAGSDEEEAGWPAYLNIVASRPQTEGARLARACWESIQWGYTSVRDLAGCGCEVAKAVDDGTIVGPNIYSSGACLSQLAGHGDIFSLGAGDVLGNIGANEIHPGHHGDTMACICDGLDECRRAVRLQIRRGAKCIKVLASGGVMSSDDNPTYAQFSPSELEVIVEEATRMGRSVAAHVHGQPGVMAAIKAGVTTLEHGTFADEECVKLAKEKGIVYVATSFVIRMLLDTKGEGLPKKIWEKVKLVATNHQHAYELAVKHGCTIALGSDTPPGYPEQAKEIDNAVKAGLSNLEAIRAATANGPLTVKGQAPKTGQLKVGYEADFIGVLEDPVEDVKVLQKKENIKWVWKGGKIFKGPGVGPWGED